MLKNERLKVSSRYHDEVSLYMVVQLKGLWLYNYKATVVRL